ncbi:unnamed protein product [Effrenium voratum]|nr:unnamed protein product [Effrenium voratum]
MGTCSTNVMAASASSQVARGHSFKNVPTCSAHGAQGLPISPCLSWQGPDQGTKCSRPDRSMHERHVQVLEKFLTAVEQEPVFLEKAVLKRRKRATEAARRPDASLARLAPGSSIVVGI